MTFATAEFSFKDLSRIECVFAALWHSSGAATTEAIASYYDVPVTQILDVVATHHEEFEIDNDNWTPRSAIRIGMLLNCPIAKEVRTQALDFIEAHKRKDKRECVSFLLQNAGFAEWSDRAIAKIVECSPTTVGGVRRSLESTGKILKFEKRKATRNGKDMTVSVAPEENASVQFGQMDTSNPDSSVERPLPRVRVSKVGHPRDGQECTVIEERENHWQKLVRFDDGEEIAFAIPDLDAPSSPIPSRPTIPRTYTEDELQRAIARAIEESQIGNISKAREEAEAQVRDELEAQRAIAQQRQQENIKLQQKINELESLKRLEDDNKQLRQEIESLKTQLQEQAARQWENPLNKDASKLLNAEVRKAVESLEPELHLRSLTVSAPDNAEECLQLMGLALKNIAIAINNTQALEAAAILLGEVSSQLSVVSNQSPIPTVAEALIQIKSVLINPDCTWNEFWAVAEPFQSIKEEYWRSLSKEERSQIRQLRQKQECPPQQKAEISIGDRVTIADQYSTLSGVPGTVYKIESGMFLVHWDTVERPLFQHRYEESELQAVAIC